MFKGADVQNPDIGTYLVNIGYGSSVLGW